jgi:hypothetical protein
MSDLINSVVKALDQFNATSNVFRQVDEIKTTDVEETGVSEKDPKEVETK